MYPPCRWRPIRGWDTTRKACHRDSALQDSLPCKVVEMINHRELCPLRGRFCAAASFRLQRRSGSGHLGAIQRKKVPMSTRPFRSALYIPGSKPRALEKARSLAVDAILFDLEDAVAPDEKSAARQTLADELEAGGYGDRVRIVRINGLDTPWGADDAAAVAGMSCAAVLLPKPGGGPKISMR